MSITLTNSTTISVLGTVKEVDSTDAANLLTVDFQAQTFTFVLRGGSLSGQVFTPGASGDNVTVSINYNTGAYFVTGGNVGSGQLTPTQLTAIQTVTRRWRNDLEVFSVNNGIISGTQVPWV